MIAAEGLKPVSDPIAVMTMLAAEAVALVAAFRTMVSDLDALRYQGRTGEMLRAEVSLYERALDRAEKFAHNLAKLGLEERVVQLSEAQAGTLVTLVTEVLGAPDLALSAEQISTGRRLVAEGARLLVGAV
jgi:hypothetical protein